MLPLLLASLALAHGPKDCPPLPVVEEAAQIGPLAPTLRACAARGELADPAGRAVRWVLWWSEARHGAADEAALQALLEATPEPDPVLEAAEALRDHAPSLAARLSGAVRERASAWLGPVARARGLARWVALEAALHGEEGAVARARGLRALGVVGPALDAAMALCEVQACEEPEEFPFLAPPPPPAPGELVACTDVGHLAFQAALGGVYASERECVARAALVPGPEQQALARLALLLALKSDDLLARAVLARHLAPVLGDDPELVRAAAEVHRRAGDEVGARAWEARTGDAAR